eukprot:5559403-Alexandrium_andersonii.AAC.1
MRDTRARRALPEPLRGVRQLRGARRWLELASAPCAVPACRSAPDQAPAQGGVLVSGRPNRPFSFLLAEFISWVACAHRARCPSERRVPRRPIFRRSAPSPPS